MEPEPLIRSFIQRWLATSLGVFVAAFLVQGIHYDTWTGLFLASLLLGIFNAFLRPVLIFFSLPLLLFTLGLFLLVINALLLYWVGWLVPSFQVAGFWAAFWGGLVISLVSGLANFFLKPAVPTRPVPPRNPPPPPGSGPIIDV